VFQLKDSTAKEVGVSASFNKWKAKDFLLTKSGDTFSGTVSLTPGYHRYKFVVDGNYTMDPAAEEFDPGPKGSDNCMILVGPREDFLRDFTKYPVIVDLPPVDRLIAIGDVHGAPKQLLGTLKTTGLAEHKNGTLQWTGGDSVLVFTGDYEDRGPDAKAVFDIIMGLEPLAEKAGGKVVALLGNHDLWMIEKYEGWTDTRESFERVGLNFDEVMGPKGKYGIWLRNRPIAARINNLFFCHGGLSRLWNPAELISNVEKAINSGRWGAAELAKRESILWSRFWWTKPLVYKQALKQLGCQAVVFGHTIGAIGDKGRISHKDKEVISIDTGMCPHYGHSQGAALEVVRQANIYRFNAVYTGGEPEELFTRQLLSKNQLNTLEKKQRLELLEKKAQ
jgi:hypothetical protein